MTNYDINAFLEVMKHGNISKAAEKMFVTQSALSLRLHRLESDPGCKLFIRSKGIRNIELTQEGRQFVKIAEQWGELYKSMKELKNLSMTYSFRISSINSVSRVILPDVYTDFLNIHRNVSLETEDLSSFSSYDSIESKRVDFAIVTDLRYSMKAICKPLFEEEMKFVCSKDTNYQDNINMESLNPFNYIYCPWFLEFEQWSQMVFGKGFRPKLQVQIISHIEFFLESGGCWSIVPSSVEKLLLKNPKICSRKLNEKIPKRNIMYLTSDEKLGGSELIDSFVSCFKKRLQEMEKDHIVICKIP